MNQNRPLTAEERSLARWMLDHGSPTAKDFLSQLEEAEITPWRCPCGCASIQFQIRGHEVSQGALRVIADFIFGDNNESGIFMFEKKGLLSGIEVYSFARTEGGPKSLPSVEVLRPISDSR